MTISSYQLKIMMSNLHSPRRAVLLDIASITGSFIRSPYRRKVPLRIFLAIALVLPVRFSVGATIGECIDQSFDPSAEKACQELVDDGNTSADVYLRLAQALNGLGKRSESYIIVEQGLVKNPGNAALRELKAIVRSNLSEQEYLDTQNRKGPSANAANRAKLRILRIKCLKQVNQEALDACNEFADLGGQDAEVTARQSSLQAELAPPPAPEPEPVAEVTEVAEVHKKRTVIDLTPNVPTTETAVPVIPPTPSTTAQSPQEDRNYDDERLELVRSIQVKLNSLGFAAGTPDGVSGAKTRQAISNFYDTTNIGNKQPVGQALLNDLNKAEQVQNEVFNIYRQSEQALASGDLDRAAELFNTARNTASWAPSIAGLSNRLENARANQRNTDEEKRKQDIVARIESLLRNNNLDEAGQQLDNGLQNFPNDANLQVLRDEYDSARRQQQQAAARKLANDQRNTQIDQSIALATAQFSSGNFNEALTALSEAEALAPTSDRVLNLRNRIEQEQQRQVSESRAIDARQRQVATFVEQANESLNRGELDSARTALDKALAADPEFQIGSDMQTRIDELTQRDNDTATALQLLSDAESAIKRDQLDQAQSLVAQAQVLNSSLAGADQLLSRIASRRGELESQEASNTEQSEQAQRLAALLQKGGVLRDAREQRLSTRPDYFTDEIPASIGKLFEQ